jgi:diguanylate cyclase (GGDEF)-like protein
VWRAAPRLARIAAVASIALAAAGAAVRFGFPSARAACEPLFGLAVGVPMALAVGRGLSLPRERPAWATLAVGLLLVLAASQLGMPSGHGAPPDAFGAGDALWLARFPFLYGALGLLVATRTPQFGVRPALDGLIGAFAAGGLFSLVAAPWIVGGAQADPGLVDVRSLYPLLEVLVLGFLAGAAALNGWPARIWLPLLLDIGLFAAAGTLDIRHALQHPGEPLGWATYPGFLVAAWSLAAACFAMQEDTRRLTTARRGAIWPVVLAAAAVVTLFAASWHERHLAALLGAAALVVALPRQWLVHRDNDHLLAHSRAEALTDALTGLGNRRALTADLAEAAAAATPGRPLSLALFDLDGFKQYNDAFGHPAGDSLLQRLGIELDATVGSMARAYRMGGDEFCVLATGAGDHTFLVAAGHQALAEQGEGFRVSASCGVARLPADARDPMDLLRVADQRMYAEKGAQRRIGQPDDAATSALLQIVRERDPALGEHIAEVAAWAVAVARRLDAGADVIEQTRLGGELHDIGKTAIPDAILDKPGKLTDDEWAFMRRHTIIGERILLADPALAHIAPVARSHHERWGGGGYPDGLIGREIPLAARIVSVCDAYEAMVADRAYRAGVPIDAAAAELRRCAGTQFDPTVVDAFLAILGPKHAAAVERVGV